MACELPALRAVPLSRFSIADVREEAIACGLVEQRRYEQTAVPLCLALHPGRPDQLLDRLWWGERPLRVA